MDTTAIFSIILGVTSLAFSLAFIYENKKRQQHKKTEREKLRFIESSLKEELEILNTRNIQLVNKERIQSLIIDCANYALVKEELFHNSMQILADSLRLIFNSEYCAIGKLVNEIVEDYAIAFEEQDHSLKKEQQKKWSESVRQVDLNDSCYMVCKALDSKDEITFFEEGDINKECNKHFDIYRVNILRSSKLKNTTIIPLRDNQLNNFGYIQFINSEKEILFDTIEPFLHGLLQLIQLTINKEKNQKQLETKAKLVRDSNFIKDIISKRDNIDSFLDEVMFYLTKEFNAAIISFRIPLLNGAQKNPVFYLRRCYVNHVIRNHSQLIKYYYNNRGIKKLEELGGYTGFKCIKFGEISYEDSFDFSYYSEFHLENEISTKKSIIMPILRDVDRHKCLRTNNKYLCNIEENNDCIDRFKKLYGLFKLRIFEEISSSDLNEVKERLENISQQITLILNSNVDKNESESIKAFQSELKKMNFVRIKEFDEQAVDVIKNSTHSKGCSIYRMKKGEDNENVLYLSATTSSKIRYDNKDFLINEDIKKKLFYPISDQRSFLVRVFNEIKSKYLYNLKGNHSYFGEFIEILDDSSKMIIDESFFILPIVKKDNTCIGVVLLIGKEEGGQNISTSFWEQDREFIEFVVDVIARLSEADSEKLTFLSQLGHELTAPITEIIEENQDGIGRYVRDRDSISKGSLVKQLEENINTCMLFKHVIMDVEYNYSSSVEIIDYDIELHERPQDVLLWVVRLFEKEASFSKQIKIVTNVSNMPSINIDKYRIIQVFINLLKNAIRYSHKGTQIDIFYKKSEEAIDGTLKKWHEIKFVNWGIGILEEDRERIFSLYARGKNAKQLRQSGTGMGLYIVNEIIKAHKGHCIIRKLNNPTEISILLPENR